MKSASTFVRDVRRSANRRGACAVETLEARRMLASTIEGFVFHDHNANGVYNPGLGEQPADWVRVFIDTNNNGTWEEGTDPVTYTNHTGNWSMGGLAPNTQYRIVVDNRPAEGTSTPRIQNVMTGADGTTVNANPFGIERSRIQGRVFIDNNNNGTYDLGEGRGNIRVFLDMNKNGVFDAGDHEAWTAPTFLPDGVTPNPNAGNYVFNYIDAGNYDVRVFPAHYQSVIGDNPIPVNLGVASTQSNVDFAIRNLSSIGGLVFRDTNGNGTREAGEQLLNNVRVYADLNGNGQFDNDEPSALSLNTLTPQGVNYFIQAIPPGTYTVRADLPAGYQGSNPPTRNVTVVAGQETVHTNFGLTTDGTTPPPPAGDVPNDFNGDGKQDLIVTLNNTSTVWYMDGTKRIGTASLPNLGAGFRLAAYGDFDGDKKPDLLAHNPTTGATKIVTLNGVTQKGVVNLGAVNTNWQPVGAGDFNGDGHLDIVWRNETTGQNTTWRMNGTTRTSFKALPSTADLNWFIAGVGDFNNDGNEDLVWRHSGNGRNTAWLMTDAKVPTFKALPSTADQNWRPVAITNFNNDDIPDILWINAQTNANSVWLMTQGQPNFSRVTL